MNRNRSLSLWRSGLGPLSELTREMDHFFEDFWAQPSRALKPIEGVWSPACDVEEKKDHYLVTLEMPGISKDQIKIEALDDQLVVSGERKFERESREGETRYTERRFGTFQRSFALPSGVSAEQVQADYEDGVLRILVPKVQAAQPKQIKIGERSGLFGSLLGPSKPEESRAGTGERAAS
jgi:HSP20 family protein